MHIWNLHFFIVSEARNAWVTFVKKPQIQIISFQNGKHGYLMQYLIRQGFEFMSVVTLNLLVDSVLIKMLYRFVNFEEIQCRM